MLLSYLNQLNWEKTMNQLRRKPKRVWYLKQLDPLWIFKVKGQGAKNIYLAQGCVEITKEEYNSYPKKGKQ